MQVQDMVGTLQLADEDFLKNGELLHATVFGLIGEQLSRQFKSFGFRFVEVADQVVQWYGLRIMVICKAIMRTLKHKSNWTRSSKKQISTLREQRN